MYEYLTGILAERLPAAAVVETGGIGFFLHIPLSTYDQLPHAGAEVKLYCHYAPSDDEVRLFGFFTKAERDLFRRLISVSRIGPKIALAILSGLSVDDFITAITTANIKLLATIAGLGKKSAQRLIMELGDKLADFTPAISQGGQGGGSDILREAEAGLSGLGFAPKDITWAFKNLADTHLTSVEAAIKQAIKLIGSKRND